jgi:hypothetical protein
MPRVRTKTSDRRIYQQRGWNYFANQQIPRWVDHQGSSRQTWIKTGRSGRDSRLGTSKPPAKTHPAAKCSLARRVAGGAESGSKKSRLTCDHLLSPSTGCFALVPPKRLRAPHRIPRWHTTHYIFTIRTWSAGQRWTWAKRALAADWGRTLEFGRRLICSVRGAARPVRSETRSVPTVRPSERPDVRNHRKLDTQALRQQ